MAGNEAKQKADWQINCFDQDAGVHVMLSFEKMLAMHRKQFPGVDIIVPAARWDEDRQSIQNALKKHKFEPTRDNSGKQIFFAGGLRFSPIVID